MHANVWQILLKRKQAKKSLSIINKTQGNTKNKRHVRKFPRFMVEDRSTTVKGHAVEYKFYTKLPVLHMSKALHLLSVALKNPTEQNKKTTKLSNKKQCFNTGFEENEKCEDICFFFLTLSQKLVNFKMLYILQRYSLVI